METNKVDAAVESLEQSEQLVGMLGGVVDAAPADVLKAHAALVAPVVLLEEGDDVREVVGLLNRHNLLAFSTKRIV